MVIQPANMGLFWAGPRTNTYRIIGLWWFMDVYGIYGRWISDLYFISYELTFTHDTTVSGFISRKTA